MELVDWLVGSKVQEKTWKINGWNLRIHPWKRKIIFQTILFRFYVILWGCICLALFLHIMESGMSHVLCTGYCKIMLLWPWFISKIDTHKFQEQYMNHLLTLTRYISTCRFRLSLKKCKNLLTNPIPRASRWYSNNKKTTGNKTLYRANLTWIAQTGPLKRYVLFNYGLF